MKRWKFHIPNRRWKGKTLWRRSGSENIHLNPGSPRPRRRTRKSSRRIRRIFFNPTSRLIVVNDFWSISGNFIYRHHVEPPSKTVYADWNIVPIPLQHWRYQDYKYIIGCNAGEKHRRLLELWWRSRVVRYVNRFHKIHYVDWITTGSIYMVQVKTDDFWNVCGDRELSDAWTGFTRFIVLNERPPDGYTWCGGGDLQENRRHQDQRMCGKMCGDICLMHRNEREAKKQKNTPR